jgi:hypothetical protein
MHRWIILVIGISAAFLYGCEIQSPEIRGVVIDANTKQPIEGAWVHATVWIQTKTVSGDAGRVVSLDPPHTRTGKDGKFLIPRRELKSAPFPLAFGTRVDKFAISAVTLDKSGQKEIQTAELKLNKIDVSIYLEDLETVWKKELSNVPSERFNEEREQREFAGLQALYNYCLTGRFSVEVPSVEGGCDAWELKYVISKHEVYIQGYESREDKRSHLSIALEQLGLLFEKQGHYIHAIASLKKARMLRHFNPATLDSEILRIEKKLFREKRIGGSQ